MATTTYEAPGAVTPGRRSVLGRIVVGVDGSREALEAARQAALLADVGADLTVVGAWNLSPSVVGAGEAYSYAYDYDYALPKDASDSVYDACGHIGAVSAARGKVVRGLAWRVLVDEAEAERATLIAIGSHGQGRARGILVGSTATELIHKAPCAVLVARRTPATFPRRIVVGIDGSAQSAAAYAAARSIAERFGAMLWPVVAHGGKGVDKRLVSLIVDYHHEDSPDHPVRALVAAAAEADLVVVGSRGLHGLSALGSVSERVAHRARCSTLIVRERQALADDA
jgi:nucleotide-binding universal stress UspA family protein